MKIFGRIVSAIYILAGIIFSIFLLIIWANPYYVDILSTFLKKNVAAIGAVGMVLVILGVIYIVNWFEYINKTKNISFDNPGGEVKISLKAIEDSITALISKQIDGIKSLRVKNYVSPKGLETKFYLKLTSGHNIPETCATIQEITKNYLQDAVGVERVSNIEVYVTNISKEEFLNEKIPEQTEDEPEQ
ncbi:MAG TPA: alkaline shock response membrane anchor protein AmaP [bacterium]|nr:alkaline shock response membrane anchor protein AmaP [bacterium]